MPTSDYLANKQLEHQTGTPYTAPTLHIGLSSTAPASNGTNVTEPSSNNYARVSMSGKWGSVSARTVTNNTAVTFPTSTGAWLAGVDLPYWVAYDASNSGNLMHYGALVSGNRLYFDEDDINTGTDRITITSHGFSNGERAFYNLASAGGTAATGLTAGIGTLYYVKSIDTNTVELYTDSGLTSLVNITATGTGTMYLWKVSPRNVSASGVTLQINASNITLSHPVGY